jgi:hypothetical protein
MSQQSKAKPTTPMSTRKSDSKTRHGTLRRSPSSEDRKQLFSFPPRKKVSVSTTRTSTSTTDSKNSSTESRKSNTASSSSSKPKERKAKISASEKLRSPNKKNASGSDVESGFLKSPESKAKRGANCYKNDKSCGFFCASMWECLAINEHFKINEEIQALASKNNVVAWQNNLALVNRNLIYHYSLTF